MITLEPPHTTVDASDEFPTRVIFLKHTYISCGDYFARNRMSHILISKFKVFFAAAAAPWCLILREQTPPQGSAIIASRNAIVRKGSAPTTMWWSGTSPETALRGCVLQGCRGHRCLKGRWRVRPVTNRSVFSFSFFF